MFLLQHIMSVIVIQMTTNTVYVLAVNYAHTSAEIELTKSVVIEGPKCQNGWTHVFVFSAAQTSGKYYERRKLTRDTWVRETRQHRIRAVFVLALTRDNHTVQQEIVKESEQFGDIIQFAFI